MTDTVEAAEPPSQKPRRDHLGLALSGLGQLLVTAGVVVVLFLVYEVWVTNIFSDHKQDQVHSELLKQWADTPDDPLVQEQLPLPGGAAATLPVGTGIAVLYIPRFGRDFAKAIVEGTGDAQLAEGPGHYAGTQLPGQKGNFAVAGHRVGKGEPFLNLDQLRPGDPLVVQTKSTWFIYQVLGDVSTGDLSAPNQTGVVGRQIVSPSNTSVIAPVPTHPQVPASEALDSLITLTTCHPKFSASQRMIIHGTLSRTIPAAGSALPKELGGTL